LQRETAAGLEEALSRGTTLHGARKYPPQDLGFGYKLLGTGAKFRLTASEVVDGLQHTKNWVILGTDFSVMIPYKEKLLSAASESLIR
jgi:hypothetical protein